MNLHNAANGRRRRVVGTRCTTTCLATLDLIPSQGRWKLYNIGVAGSSKSLKYWYGLMWQTVVNFSNIGVAAAIPYHQVPPPLHALYD